MSEVFTIDFKENNSDKSGNIKEESTTVLSEYVKSLESHVKRRYLEKIAVIGIDPALLVAAKLDPECLPPIEAADLLSYLVLETSYYTLKQFKAHKSLEAYNQMISGFITSVQGKIFNEKFVVVGKVRHSQRMNEAPLPVWIIASKEGTIISAHCLGCKAGLAESCSHVASVLFYVEAWTRINGKLACTQVKCTWLLPTYVNEVPYSEVKDINFKSARKIKNELDKEIDGKNSYSKSPSSESSSSNSNHKVAKAEMLDNPSVEEMNSLFQKLNEDKQKAAILSLIPPYSESFVSKSRQIPTLPDLFDPENIKLTYPGLMKKCLETEISISGEEIKAIEKDTRDQSSGAAFFRHRAGRIGASQIFSVAHTNPAQPAQNLIKSICYPKLFNFNNNAVNHGRIYEEKAVAAYTNVMSENHKDFKVTKCGVFIDQTRPWLHATPDFLCTCSCCGDGCGEVKCPYSIQNWDFESYLLKKSSCLEKADGKFKLKRNHSYFYQVQQQLSITGSKYCDFVVCAFNNDKPMFSLERIFHDPNHWDTVGPKLTKVLRTCVLPELLARWYTRKQHAPSLTSASTSSGPCYCRIKTQERTIHCSNPECPVKEFHYSCLQVSDPVPQIWYCPNCRLLKEFQKPRRASKAQNTTQHKSEVMKLDSICVCGKRPSVNDKLLKRHSTDCQNGKYFHLNCLDYKRMPNNSQTTWLCSSCKVKAGSTKGKNVKSIPNVTKNIDSHSSGSCLVNDTSDSLHTSDNPNYMSKAAIKNGNISINPTTCTSTTSFSRNVPVSPPGNIYHNRKHPTDKTDAMKGIDCNSANTNAGSVPPSPAGSSGSIGNSVSDNSDDDIEITKLTERATNKHASLGKLSDNHFDTILSPTGWLDCTTIQQAHVCLQKVNPFIEGFQRPTLGPFRNFDIMTGEFVQILHTGHSHWVCVSSVGCQPNVVNLFDSLSHDIIEKEVKEQVESLMADSNVEIKSIPVQQQQNGSDCGIFAIAFSTCIVYGLDPRDMTFDIPRMRPHLLQCLKDGMITPFPTF